MYLQLLNQGSLMDAHGTYTIWQHTDNITLQDRLGYLHGQEGLPKPVDFERKFSGDSTWRRWQYIYVTTVVITKVFWWSLYHLSTYCPVSTHTHTASMCSHHLTNFKHKDRFPTVLLAQPLTYKHKVQITVFPHNKFPCSHAKTLTGNLEWKSLTRQVAALLENG